MRSANRGREAHRRQAERSSVVSFDESSQHFSQCSSEDALTLALEKPAIVDGLFQLSWKGKQNPAKVRNHLTPRGQIVTAIRRMCSQAAANAFGAAVLADLGGKQVNQSERMFGAARIRSFQSFHANIEAEIASAWGANKKYAISCHAFSACLS